MKWNFLCPETIAAVAAAEISTDNIWLIKVIDMHVLQMNVQLMTIKIR